MPGNLRKFVESLLGSQRDLSFSTLEPGGYPQSIIASYANDGLSVFVCTKSHGHQVRNLSNCAKACVTVVSLEKDWGDVRGVTLRGSAAVLAGPSPAGRQAVELLQRKFPESERLFRDAGASLALIRFDPVAVVVLDHWDGIGFAELVEVDLGA